MYLLILALCQASMFSSHGQVSSMRIILFSLLEKIVMSGLSSVNAMWGGKEKVPSRSPNKTQSDAWYNIPLGKDCLCFTLLPFFTNFILIVCFVIGNCRFSSSRDAGKVKMLNTSQENTHRTSSHLTKEKRLLEGLSVKTSIVWGQANDKPWAQLDDVVSRKLKTCNSLIERLDLLQNTVYN